MGNWGALEKNNLRQWRKINTRTKKQEYTYSLLYKGVFHLTFASYGEIRRESTNRDQELRENTRRAGGVVAVFHHGQQRLDWATRKPRRGRGTR
jgi:hypothetical protein